MSCALTPLRARSMAPMDARRNHDVALLAVTFTGVVRRARLDVLEAADPGPLPRRRMPRAERPTVEC